MFKRIDLSKWRIAYLTGDDDVTLETLSQIPGAPALSTLKKHSAQESWTDQRKHFRNHTATLIVQSEAVVHAADQVQRLVDIAETVTRQIKLAKALQNAAVKALKDLDTARISPRDIPQWIKISTELERLAIGLATSRIEVDRAVDVTQLSDEELEQIVNSSEDLN
jgi:hypothetical protein